MTCVISNINLQPLEQLTSLEELVIDTTTKDDDFKYIGALTGLKSLVLGNVHCNHFVTTNSK